jgi:hypothetical protein
MIDAREIQKKTAEMQDSPELEDLFSKLVSGGKAGYKTIIEKNKKLEKCSCGKILYGDEKFCPECGCKVEKKK